MHQFLTFILFWNNTLHVSDVLSAHHQEFKTVDTAAGTRQTDAAVCLLASRQQKLLHLVGCNIEIYSDARSYERQICILIVKILKYKMTRLHNNYNNNYTKNIVTA
jgi:hypothetical protein